MKLFVRCSCNTCRILIPYDFDAKDITGPPFPKITILCDDCTKAGCSATGAWPCKVDWGTPDSAQACKETSLTVVVEPVFISPAEIGKGAMEATLQAQREAYADMLKSEETYGTPLDVVTAEKRRKRQILMLSAFAVVIVVAFIALELLAPTSVCHRP